MYERARAGKIKPEDIRGATFTISNMGPFNVVDFSAIISSPEAGILAVSSSRRTPIARDDGTLGVGTRMNMTLSVDHRVSNGAEGAAFCNALRELIENPLRMLDVGSGRGVRSRAQRLNITTEAQRAQRAQSSLRDLVNSPIAVNSSHFGQR